MEGEGFLGPRWRCWRVLADHPKWVMPDVPRRAGLSRRGVAGSDRRYAACRALADDVFWLMTGRVGLVCACGACALACLAGGWGGGVVCACERAVGVGGSVVYDAFQRGCARQHRVGGEHADGVPGGGVGVHGRAEHTADRERQQQRARQQQLQHGVRQHGARHGRRDPRASILRSATLSLPATATVLFAGLYWGADTSAGAERRAGPTPAAAPNAALRGQVGFQVPGSSGYSTISGVDG